MNAKQRRRYEFACRYKHPFESANAAWEVVGRARNRVSGPAGKVRAYRCEFCSKWHVGSSYRREIPKSRKARRAPSVRP